MSVCCCIPQIDRADDDARSNGRLGSQTDWEAIRTILVGFECPYMDPSPIASTPIFVRRGNDCSRVSGLKLTSINRGRATMGYSRASSPLLCRALMPADTRGFC